LLDRFVCAVYPIYTEFVVTLYGSHVRCDNTYVMPTGRDDLTDPFADDLSPTDYRMISVRNVDNTQGFRSVAYWLRDCMLDPSDDLCRHPSHKS
jgi:hypothetical protein